jgi:hypothetical protein
MKSCFTTMVFTTMSTIVKQNFTRKIKADAPALPPN